MSIFLFIFAYFFHLFFIYFSGIRFSGPSAPSSAEKERERERDRDREHERKEKESRDRERALLDKLKEERDRNKATAARSYREGGSGSMVALTAHAHSLYGRESYTPLAPGSATADRSRGLDLGGERPSLNNLFSPAMRYISPMKSVPVVSSPAPFVVRHATSDFISGTFYFIYFYLFDLFFFIDSICSMILFCLF